MRNTIRTIQKLAQEMDEELDSIGYGDSDARRRVLLKSKAETTLHYLQIFIRELDKEIEYG